MTIYTLTRSFESHRPVAGRKRQPASSNGAIKGSALGLAAGTAAILTLKVSMLWVALQAI